jgi:hypothetical protein
MQPSLSKFIKITPCSRATKLINFQIISTLSNETWNKILPSVSLKLLLPTILTSSLPFYPYHKDERALPGYLLTRCSFSPSDIKRLSLPSRCLLFTSTLTLSLSLSLFGFKGLTYVLSQLPEPTLNMLLHEASRDRQVRWAGYLLQV